MVFESLVCLDEIDIRKALAEYFGVEKEKVLLGIAPTLDEKEGIKNPIVAKVRIKSEFPKKDCETIVVQPYTIPSTQLPYNPYPVTCCGGDISDSQVKMNFTSQKAVERERRVALDEVLMNIDAVKKTAITDDTPLSDLPNGFVP